MQVPGTLSGNAEMNMSEYLRQNSGMGCAKCATTQGLAPLGASRNDGADQGLRAQDLSGGRCFTPNNFTV